MPAKPKPSAKPAKGKTVATLRDDAKRKNLPTVEYQSLMREAGGWIAPGCAVFRTQCSTSKEPTRRASLTP